MYDRVLIVCEGEKTEPKYFEGIRSHYSLSTINIHVTHAKGSDPASVIRHAKKLKRSLEREGDKYDKVYCVFDRENHEFFKNFQMQIKANQFKSAISWPCFEYWLLLHFVYSRKPFLPSKNKSAALVCESTLNCHLPNYTKGMNGIFSEFEMKLDDAIRNAKWAHNDAVQTDNFNPCTEVHLLVEYLQNIKRA